MRLAQITDLHLRHHLFGNSSSNLLRGREMPELFRRALGGAKKANADFVAVTGDIVDVPLWLFGPTWGFQTDDPGPWREAALADYRLVKELLDDSDLPYQVVPGNHDWEEAMWQVFDRADNERVVAGYRVIRFCDREFKCNVPRRFTPERDRWEAELASADPRPQVHLQHYVVTPRENEWYPHTYEEGEEITRRTIDSGKVVLSLSGHLHRGTALLRYGSTTFSTGVAFGEAPFGWRMYDVSESGVTMTPHELGPGALPRRRVVFLDRDGVINDRASYRVGPEAMTLLPGAARAIRRLNAAGLAVVVVTSQSCIGYGYVPKAVVASVHDKMARLLAAEGAALDGIYFTSAAGDRAVLPVDAHTRGCKPDPAMLHQASRELNLDLDGAWMVGDRLSDIECATRANARAILVRTGRGRDDELACRTRYPRAVVADDLAGVAEVILSSPG